MAKFLSVFFAGVAVLFYTSLADAAQGQWFKRGKDYLVACDRGEVICSSKGNISLEPKGEAPVDISFFLWHDGWIYETLSGGSVESAGVLSGGELQYKGTWGMGKKFAPVRYVMTLKPDSDEVKITLEVVKTGEVEFSQGIWASVRTSVAVDDRRIVYPYPTGEAAVGKGVDGAFLKTYIGKFSGVAAFFKGDGLRTLRSRIGDKSHNLEVKLAKQKDVPLGQKMKVLMTVGFEDFPDIEKPNYACNAPLKILAKAPRKVSLYDKCEIDVELSGRWKNPYNPDEVRLDAEVSTASGRVYSLPGFFVVGQRSFQEGPDILMIPDGKGCWKVRLAATEVGAMRVKLKARDRSGETVFEIPHAIMVQADKRAKGFVRVSRADPRYMAHDNGEGFVPIGHNVPIYRSYNEMSVNQVLEKMSSNGENWNRWWMSRSGMGIEWESELGWYRQSAAAKLDALLDDAGRLGMYYMLCMDTHQDFRKGGWKSNPFNAAQGGPCKTAGEWFTDEQAKNLYRKRLRYTVARWGYSPHVLCWEFGNEFEGWADSPQDSIIAWHREMAPLLAEIDPYDHFITTSWWSKTGPQECWKIPQLGIVQTHSYANNNLNTALEARDFCLTQWNGFEKPHLFAEFGIRSHNFNPEDDPTGRGLHNTIWASVVSGCCGSAMPWWHGNYIEPKNLYFHFKSIRNFVNDLPFGTEKWRQVSVVSPELKLRPARLSQRNVVLNTRSDFRKPSVNIFRVSDNGEVNDSGELLSKLHGRGHGNLVNPPLFDVDFPADGEFVMHVGRVSNSGLLKVFVDEKQVLEKDLPCGENHGKEWRYVERWKLWESVYDFDIAVPVKAGKHRIRVENHGADWVTVETYTFTGCRKYETQDLLCCALASPSVAIVWIQNGDSTWVSHARTPHDIRPLPAMEYALEGFTDGEYEVEWWETWKGAPQRTENVKVKGGQLVLKPGVVATDVAAKIRALK